MTEPGPDDPQPGAHALGRRALIGAGGALAAGLLLPWDAAATASAGSASSRRLRAAAVPAPTGAIVTRWDTDPWSRGSYSALPTGVSPEVRTTLAENLIGGRIALAGEYADWAHSATVPGALRSGRAAAYLLDDDGPGVSGRTVAVVGAGLAGLGAATQLAALGARVIVIEARNRVGGRVATDRSWGVPVELGAAWLHGVGRNVMVPLVRQAGLGRVPTNYDNEVYRNIRTGRYDPTAAQRSASLIAQMDRLAASDPPVTMSVATWLTTHGWIPDGPDDWAVSTEIVQEYGLDADLLGTSAITEGANDIGRDDMVKGGYDRVPQMLARKLDVRLSTPVSSVAVEGRKVRVTGAGGQSILVDMAVVAVPLALLQAGVPSIAAMSARMQAALGALTTGNLEKVVLRFDRQWWALDRGDRVRVLGLVGGRWTEWYDITDVTGVPSLVAFCGGGSARRRPATDAACAAEAKGELAGAFGG